MSRARLVLERDRAVDFGAGEATSAEVLTYDDVVNAVEHLKRANVQPADDGHYRAAVHPSHAQRARMLLRRISYPGSRKARRALRRLRGDVFAIAVGYARWPELWRRVDARTPILCRRDEFAAVLDYPDEDD